MYKNNELVEILDPGYDASSFGYDANGRLTTIRNALANDWLAADPTRAASAANATTIAYDSTGRAQSVTLPAADGCDHDQPAVEDVHVRVRHHLGRGLRPVHGIAESVTYDSGPAPDLRDVGHGPHCDADLVEQGSVAHGDGCDRS